MKDELNFKDFYDFLIDNIKTILGTILLFILVVTGLVIYSHISVDPSEDVGDSTGSPVELTRGTLTEERYQEVADWPLEIYSESQISQMQRYLLPRAYRITIYTEHEDHEPIANTTFMREVFRNRQVLDYVESRLGEELTPALEFAVHVENLANSGVYELHFQRGTREESLELGYIMMDAIQEDVIPVLENKTVYFVSEEPIPIINDYSEYTNDTNRDSSGVNPQAIIRDILIYSIIAAVIGLIVGIIVALVLSSFKSKITALHDYAREESDKIIRLNHLKKIKENEKIKKGLNNINLPEAYKKIIIYDTETEEYFESLFTQVDSNISRYTDFSLVRDSEGPIDEIVILSLVNETSKSWYNNQRVQLKGYNIAVKVIQF